MGGGCETQPPFAGFRKSSTTQITPSSPEIIRVNPNLYVAVCWLGAAPARTSVRVRVTCACANHCLVSTPGVGQGCPQAIAPGLARYHSTTETDIPLKLTCWRTPAFASLTSRSKRGKV